MDASDVTEVCRLCPTNGTSQNLLSVFDERLSVKNNMKEVILVTTGIEISESDIVSKKICRKCYKNTQKIYEIRQTALQQDQHLKEKCQQYLGDKGIRLPNTCITIRKDIRLPFQHEKQTALPDTDPRCSQNTEFVVNRTQKSNDPKVATSRKSRKIKGIKGIHPTVIDVYRKYPHFKLPKRSLERHVAPIVSLAMGEVETYFRKRKLDMFKYIYKQNLNVPQSGSSKSVAKKKTAAPASCPFKIRRLSPNRRDQDLNTYGSSCRAESSYSFVHNSVETESRIKSKADKNMIPKSPDLKPSEHFSNIPVSNKHCTSKAISHKREGKVGTQFSSNALKDYESAIPKNNVVEASHQSRIVLENNSSSSCSLRKLTSVVQKIKKNGTKSQTSDIVNKSAPFVDLDSDEISQDIFNIKDDTLPSEKTRQTDISDNNVISPITVDISTISPITVENDKNVDIIRVPATNLSTTTSEVINGSKSLDICRTVSLPKGSKNANKCSPSNYIEYIVDETLAPVLEESNTHVRITDIGDSPVEPSNRSQHETTSLAESTLPTSKPEFIQSLGLTPATYPSQSHNILVCKICHCQQNNIAALRKHTSRHRVCPYCKLKFKSIENKQIHTERNCEVKKIIESPGLFIDLKKVELDIEIRKKYENAFSGFEPIPGLEDLITINEDSMESDIVLVLSDDDEPQLSSNENDVIVLDAYTDVSNPEEPQLESVSVVRPVVTIHNNTVLTEVGNISSEKQFIRGIASYLRKTETLTEEETVQTEELRNPEIVVNKNDTCLFMKFKSNLLSQIVPVRLYNGDFNVSYESHIETDETNSKFEDWSELPIIEKRITNMRHEMPLLNATYPLTFLTSQVQSSQLSLSSIQLMTATPTMSFFLPNTSTFIPSTSISVQPSINSTVTQSQTVNNTFFGPINNATIQTAPMVQNYTLSMASLPIINSQVPIQTTSVKTTAADNKTCPESITVSTTENSTGTSCTTVFSSRKSLPTNLTKTKKSSKTTRRSLSVSTKTPSKTKRKRQVIKVKIGNLASCSSSSKKASQFRVKNVWELK